MKPQAPYGGVVRTNTQFHITDYLRILHKRRWTATLAFLVVFVWGAYSSLKTTPIYEATASVQIEEDQAPRASTLDNVLDNSDSSYDDDFYQTQYKILQSRALSWRAVKALHLDTAATLSQASSGTPRRSFTQTALDWVKQAIGAPKRIDPPAADETTAQSDLINTFLGGLQVVPVRATHLVDLRYQSPDPAFAANAANALAQQYRTQAQEQRFESSKETTEWLDQELADQKTKVEASDLALQQYKETHDAVSLDAGQNIIVQRLGDLTTEATKATLDRIAKEATYRNLKDAQTRGDKDSIESLPTIMANEFVQKLKTTLVELNQEKSKLAASYGPNMPQMVDLDNQIKTTQARLDAEIQKAVDAVTNDFKAAQATEQQLQQQLDNQKAQTLSLNRKGIEYADLLRESQSNHTLYDSLLARAKETGVTRDFKGSNIQLVDAAEVPRAPILPQTSHDLFVAFMEGCALAFALSFGLEYLDNRIRTPDEIREHLGLSFLGLVPQVDEPKAGEEQILLLNRSAPPSFGEAIRAIRTSLIFSSADEGVRSVVITSTAPSEGKTLVSTNLAASLAQTGQRTLIIDADLRRPRVHEVLGRPQEPGLSNLLVGTTEAHEAIQLTTVPSLFFLGAGHLPPNPAELLASARYQEFMGHLRHQFDWIIIDAPPVMAVTDAAVVANRSSGVVFVIGAEMTTRRNALAAIEQLTAAKAHFIGAVLNKVDLKNHSYYYSPYYRKDYTRAYERAR